MKGKIVWKSLIVAVISTIIPFVFAGFFIGCVSPATGVEGFDSCGYMQKINTIWAIFVFLLSLISSLIVFGLGDKQ